MEETSACIVRDSFAVVIRRAGDHAMEVEWEGGEGGEGVDCGNGEGDDGDGLHLEWLGQRVNGITAEGCW